MARSEGLKLNGGLTVKIMDLFLTNTVFHFTRHELMDGRGVDSCDVLSAVWTLLLTVPIHCRGSVW